MVTIGAGHLASEALIGGLDGLTLDPREVLEARLFSLADLPTGMPENRRELAALP
jgi:8-oxo-dGTP diphosphatase